MGKGEVLYAQHEGLVVLKFVGQIRLGDSYGASAALNNFLDDLFEKGGFENVLIDLTETESIDSTNLGLLAKVTRHMRENYGRNASIISTNPDITAALDSVGFTAVFDIYKEPLAAHANLEALGEATEPESDFSVMVLAAHRALCELNEKNKETFKNLIEIFEKEV